MPSLAEKPRFPGRDIRNDEVENPAGLKKFLYRFKCSVQIRQVLESEMHGHDVDLPSVVVRERIRITIDREAKPERQALGMILVRLIAQNFERRSSARLEK